MATGKKKGSEDFKVCLRLKGGRCRLLVARPPSKKSSAARAMAREDLLYFEPQTAALCGVHALNTLLQGPYFDEVSLAEMALELNEAEAALMSEGGIASVEYQAFLLEQQEGGNVRADGMFSIQVLAKALEVWGLEAVPLSSPDAASERAAPERERAFIANLHEHWFTVRQLHGQWWNFNSTFSAPEPLSDFYVSAFLGTLQEQGYTLFVIKGALPSEPHPDMGQEGGGAGRWVPPEEAHAATKAAHNLKQAGFLQAAYSGLQGKASAGGTTVRLRTTGSKRPAASDGSSQGKEDAEMARAIAASLGEGSSGGGAGDAREAGGSGGGGRQWAADEEADLAAAIAASLGDAGAAAAPDAEHAAAAEDGAELGGSGAAGEASSEPPLPLLGPEPDAGAGVVEVAVRDPTTGQRHGRRFLVEDTVGHVAAFAVAQCGGARGTLAAQFPRRPLEDLGQSLAAAGVGNKQVLVLEKA